MKNKAYVLNIIFGVTVEAISQSKAKAELRQAQKELKDFIDKVNAEEGDVKPEYKTEPPVSGTPVPEGKAVDVTVSDPEKVEGLIRRNLFRRLKMLIIRLLTILWEMI